MTFRRRHASDDRDLEQDPGRLLRPVPNRATVAEASQDAARGAPSVARSVLSLQSIAGNAAVARAVQRQPKPPKTPPKWATDAEATLKSMFPKEKLIQGVVIKDYADTNATLQGGPYAAWTNSPSEIYLRDPAGLGTTAAEQGQKLRYVLQHEANHIRQFQGKGPPKLWETMVGYELKAYANDLKWLDGDGKKVITDHTIHADLVKGVRKNQADLKQILKDVKGKQGKARDEAILDELLDKNLVPPNATANPQDLYKQP
jgi:hypothetical protein